MEGFLEGAEPSCQNGQEFILSPLCSLNECSSGSLVFSSSEPVLTQVKIHQRELS